MERLNPLLVELTRVLATTPHDQPISARMCQAFAEILNAQGGSIAVGLDPQERVVLCATDDNAARVEDMQDVLGEGPCLDVARSGAAVTGIAPAEQRRRWPLYFDLLDDAGPPLSLDVFPLMPQAVVLGTLCVYRTDPADLADLAKPADEAQLLANAIGVALLGDASMSEVSEERWTSRDQIDHATGMVIAQLRLPPPDALAVLRAHAFAHSTTLGVVSGWVLDRTLDFNDDDSKDGNR